MEEVHNWFPIQLDSINQDPSFWIISENSDDPTLLWEDLYISNDTAKYKVQPIAFEIVRTYMIYAHLHLMKHLDRADVWVSEAPGAEGLDYERAVLKRVSDVWLYARAIFDAIPYEPLDELLYSNENGYLDHYIFTMRPDEWPEEKAAFEGANPEALDDYLEWFRDTFRRLPTESSIGEERY